jgi:hypothetical protein
MVKEQMIAIEGHRKEKEKEKPRWILEEIHGKCKTDTRFKEWR